MLFKKISDILSLSVLIIELIGVIIFIFLKIFFNVYVIASPSMDPILKVGDVIISKKYSGNINDLEEEDIITYMGRVDSYKGKLITHEIVSIDYDNNVIYTKGINNSNIDPIVKNDDSICLSRQGGIQHLPRYDPAGLRQHQNDRAKLTAL